MTKFLYLPLAFSYFLSPTDVSAANSKTFVYCSEGSPSSFNPQIATDGTSYNASSRPVYNRLLEFKDGTTEVEPGLAESWDISKDGLIYTFKLRRGVKFHSSEKFQPKRDFNAEDVLFSFNRQRDKNHPYYKVSGGAYEFFDSMEMKSLIKEVSKVDDYTVKFILSRVEAPFLANMAMDFASILSAEYADEMMKKGTPQIIDTFPIGTGPFIFTSYKKDNMIRYDGNPNYFRGRPKIEKLVFVITPDASVRFQKLKAGECNLIAEPSPVDLKQMRQMEQLKVVEKEGLNIGYLAMNTDKEPFKKIQVREAIHHALNRKSYIEAIYLNNATLAKNPIPPSMWSYNSNGKDYDYDIKKAKELLTKAGYPNGFETEMWTMPVSRPYNPSGKKMGELMQADLAAIGIKVKLVTYDWPTYIEKAKKGEHQLIQYGWIGDNGDPDNFLNYLLSCESVKTGANVSRWCNSEFDKAVKQARSITKQEKRAELYKKAQEIFKKDIPWVTIAHGKFARAMGRNVEGYQIQPFGADRFENVEIKELLK